MQNLLSRIAVLMLLLVASSRGAEERNGLFVEVSKRTLNRSDRRASAYYTQYDRTQGYKVVIKNTSMKPMPEGELHWTILVVKASFGATEKYIGVEKVKPLRSAESMELLIGAVPITGYRLDRDYKDEMEYEIMVTHGGKEVLRSSSKPAFATLAKRARLIEDQSSEPRVAPGAAQMPGAPIPRGVIRPATPAVPVAIMPASPPAAPPVNVAPTAPAIPRAPATPAPGQAVPAEPEGATPPKPFDFFNQNKKKPAPASN